MRCDKPLPTAPDPTPPRRLRRDTKAILSRSRVHPAKMHATRMKMPSEPLLFGCRAGETDDGLRPFSSRPCRGFPQLSLRDHPEPVESGPRCTPFLPRSHCATSPRPHAARRS